nr:hypothetical protein [Streptomyces sp. S1D4-11]
MSTLPQIEPAEATGEAATLLTEVKKSLGAVPNLAKVMAHSPALLKAGCNCPPRWMAVCCRRR